MTKACDAVVKFHAFLPPAFECVKVDGMVSQLERVDLEALLGDKFVYNEDTTSIAG